MIVTIDGPSGAGKGTIATYLSEKFRLKHLDTGMLFRATALKLIHANIDPNDHQAVAALVKTVTIAEAANPHLRQEKIANIASQIAKIPEVRKTLGQLQRDFCTQIPTTYAGVILDGRDIGTVICPHAPCKLFVTADFDVRATRRLAENEDTAMDSEAIKSIMHIRDTRDQTRETAPLQPAVDAFVIDTTNLSIIQACDMAADFVDQCLKNQ